MPKSIESFLYFGFKRYIGNTTCFVLLQLQESRYPGRAIQIHEKLSSPARKREPQEAFRHHQEKQKNARIRREKFQVKYKLVKV